MIFLQGLLSVVRFPFVRIGRAIRFLIGPWMELWIVKQYQVELLQALSSAQQTAHHLSQDLAQDRAHSDGKSLQALRDELQSLDKRLSDHISAQEIAIQELTGRNAARGNSHPAIPGDGKRSA